MIRILTGDCRDALRTLEAGIVQTCVTSPPYFGLRDYNVDAQIGLEESPEAFIQELVEVFREVRRVLRDDGTLWINIGDTYAGARRGGDTGPKSTLGGSQENQDASKAAAMLRQMGITRRRDRAPAPRSDLALPGLKPKDLIGIPWMLAFALRADGWYLRQEIIWHKPNPMPESVQDRCTRAHEQIFLLTKSRIYHYDADAIAEPASPNTHARVSQNVARQAGSDGGARRTKAMKAVVKSPKTLAAAPGVRNNESFSGAISGQIVPDRNKRSVWTVGSEPFREAHFATFPPSLIEPCILAGAPRGSVVLDPFFGAGTTGIVADRHGRDCIGIEINPQYAEMASRRIARDAGLFTSLQTSGGPHGEK